MTAFCGFRVQTLLLISMLWGTSYAGFCCKPEKNRRKGERLRSPAGDRQASASYGTPACVAGTPQFPNNLQPVPLDPKRFLGKWYDYEHWYPDITDEQTSSNSAVMYINLLQDNSTITRVSLFPGSNTPAMAIEQLDSRINRETNQCRSLPAYLSYVTFDGQFTGIYYNGPTSIFLDVPSVLSVDYDNYVLFYTCDAYDTDSGWCLSPTVYVQTRMRPDQVSATLASTINNAANQILSRYCFDAGLFKMSIWQSDAPECPFAQPTDECYTSIRNAYRYLGDPNFSG